MRKLEFLRKKTARDLVFWWEPRDGTPNAGDHLAKIIVQQMLILRDKEIFDKKDRNTKLLSIGSVLHFATDNDSVWGTGINGKIGLEHLKFNKLDIRAVRGPQTRKILQEKGYNVPEVYGDPGLLLPHFFSKSLLQDESLRKDFLVIPHMNEDFTKYDKYADNLCSPKTGALSFTRQIANSDFVISSSLHGVIIAEAYGIPAVLLQNDSGEARFKYDDYYQGSGRDHYPVATNIEEAFSIEPAKKIELDTITKPLMASFPYDLW